MSYSIGRHKKLTADFWENYTTNDLKSSFLKRLRKFILEHESLLDEEEIPKNYFDLIKLKKSLSKTRLTELVPILFLTKKLFKAFRAAQEEEIQLVLDALIWEKVLHQKDIKEKLGIQIWDTEETVHNERYTERSNTVKTPFHFFKYKKNGYYNYYSFSTRDAEYSLYLPPFLRKHLIQFYEKPKDASWIPLSEPGGTELVYETGQRDIFLELQRLIAYHHQGQIKASQKKKPQVSTFGKMQRKLNLQEFYKDGDGEKSLKTLRTALLAGLVVWISKSEVEADTAKFLKKIFRTLYVQQYKSVYGMMHYLKGTGSVDSYYTNKVGDEFLELLSSFPRNEWISMENIESYLKYNFIEIKHLADHVAHNKLYYDILEDYDGDKYKEKLFINSSLYDKAITEPLIKGTLFLFAAFGLLDVAYDTPDISELSQTAYSYYDGLKYVRLNDLGAYVVGNTNEYTVPEEVSSTKIQLSNDSLTIISDKNDPTAAVILEPYTQKVTPNRFRTDFSIFLKGITNKTDLQSKIKLFKQSIPGDLPDNWIAFFKELERKIDPLSKVSNITVFKIPEDDPILINLIAKDEVFQKIVMKAEGYQILVTKKNLPKFKLRLQEYGYLMSK